MPLESQKYRLTRWVPNKVIVGTHDDAIMVTPEEWTRHPGQIRFIACRNLCKRILSKFCTVSGAHG